MPPRLHPDRPQTGSERARRSRENRERYIGELERGFVDADNATRDMGISTGWQVEHAPTIHRARASIAGRQADQD